MTNGDKLLLLGAVGIGGAFVYAMRPETEEEKAYWRTHRSNPNGEPVLKLRVWVGPVIARRVAKQIAATGQYSNVTDGTEHVYFTAYGDRDKYSAVKRVSRQIGVTLDPALAEVLPSNSKLPWWG